MQGQGGRTKKMGIKCRGKEVGLRKWDSNCRGKEVWIKKKKILTFLTREQARDLSFCHKHRFYNF